MVDLELLYRRLEQATFSQREQIAAEVVAGTSPDEIGPVLRGLDHPHRSVRLGVIEIIRRAGYRAGLRKLMGHARNFDGDDRVFALRAMAQLAEPGDDFLAASVRGWLTSSDPFVQAHASKIAATLAAVARDPAVEAPAETLDKLVIGLFAATRGAERIARIEAIERRGPRDLMAAAKLILQKGNPDIVALVCRALIRQAEVLPSPERLAPLLDAARRRLRDAPIAGAAIDDALLALGANAVSPSLLQRLDELDPGQRDALARRLSGRPAGEIALHAPAMLDALGRDPTLWSTLGPVLARAAPEVREATRAELRRLTDHVVDDLRKGKPLAPVTVASACWVLARISEPGEPLPKQLCSAVDGGAAAEGSCALAALCGRLATEEAAAVLIAMLRDPLPEVRDAAREAIRTWESQWVRIDPGAPPTIVHTYKDDRGQPLRRQGTRLIAGTGEEHVLGPRGRPTSAGETEWGGCLCCSPPHALVRRRGEGLRCPSSWASHLREDGRTLLEKDHPVGRCRRCDSPRPRARHGGLPVCIDCGAGMPGHGGGPDLEVPVDPRVPSEHGRARQRDDLPAPPTRDELEHVAAPIRAAITANVFLQGHQADQHWSGSGIVIARDGNHIAILTNRHVIEGDGERLCPLKAMTVSGETVRATAIWRAGRGVDLAVVECRVDRPDGITVMGLGDGAALVGAEVFAIGNPLGLAWSYTAGTLSAVRHWRTRDGQSIRILQTDTDIGPGSSGGGLFHRDGHLLGVMTFSCQGSHGGSAHFALSVDAIRDALAGDGVIWRDRPLVALRPTPRDS